MTAQQLLMAASAAILLALGVLHLIYTFRGPKLTPRDPALQIAMQAVSPVLTRQTTMWKAWVGFNASHSMGAILFGLVYGYLALAHAELLFASGFLLAVGLAMLGGLAVLGAAYWFSIPFRGLCVALACYVGSIAISW
ncbi:MAG: hypothetical protein ABI624_07810 [Casimicrobiaceae bacterium]